MKKVLLPTMLALAVLAVGCTTIKDSAGNSVRVIDTNKVDKAAKVIRTTVSDATAVGEILKPDVVSYLRLTVAVLDTAIASTNTSPAGLRKSIAAIPVKELSSPWATIAIANGIGAYDIFFQDQLAGVIGGNYAAITLLTAFRDGINDVLPQQQNKRGMYIERLVKLRESVNAHS
jgi:hypothetical protein